MDGDAELQRGLRRSNARFVATMNRILEQYNYPFEDDFLVSLDALTYNAPDGTKKWGEVSSKNIKEWKKEIIEYNRENQRNAEKSKQQTSDSEDGHSTVHEESSENSGAETSDTGEASDVSVASVRRKFKDIDLQHLNVEGEIKQERVRVRVDVIVQEDASNIPKWKTILRPVSSESHLTSPAQEVTGNQAAVCRKKLEMSNKRSSSRSLQSPYSDVPVSSNAIAIARRRPSPMLSKTLSDTMHEEYQSAEEECSWSNTTLGDLYPSMVELLARLMKTKSQRKVLKCMFGHLMYKRKHSRRSKLSVTADKVRGSRPFKLKKRDVICSGSEDDEDPALGNESREFSDDNCLVNNSSALVPYAYPDTNESKMDYSDSSLEHFLSGKGEKVSSQTGFSNVMARMGETFLVEDELPHLASPKNSEYTEREKLAYKCPSKYHFRTSTAGSDSIALHLAKDSKSKTQKTDFSYVGTSELRSSACSSYGNSNVSTPVTTYSPARASTSLLINPEQIISEGQISVQHKHSFSSLYMNQSPSKRAQKYGDAFEKLYEVCSKEIQKPLTRPLENSQNLEGKAMLVKSNFVRSKIDYNREFDRIYEELCGEAATKSPGFQTASHLRKYDGIQMSETVNALVNSPGRATSAICSVKRVGDFQNCLYCSPVKRLKHIPEYSFSSRKYQEISHSNRVNLQTAGMDFLSTYNCSNPISLEDRGYQSQDFGIHGSSDKTSLGIPGTSLQAPGTAGASSGWPKAMEICSSPRNVRRHHQRVYRKLSYTDGKE